MPLTKAQSMYCPHRAPASHLPNITWRPGRRLYSGHRLAVCPEDSNMRRNKTLCLSQQVWCGDISCSGVTWDQLVNFLYSVFPIYVLGYHYSLLDLSVKTGIHCGFEGLIALMRQSCDCGHHIFCTLYFYLGKPSQIVNPIHHLFHHRLNYGLLYYYFHCWSFNKSGCVFDTSEDIFGQHFLWL